jgi:hypothetical protein
MKWYYPKYIPLYVYTSFPFHSFPIHFFPIPFHSFLFSIRSFQISETFFFPSVSFSSKIIMKLCDTFELVCENLKKHTQDHFSNTRVQWYIVISSNGVRHIFSSRLILCHIFPTFLNKSLSKFGCEY